MKPKKANIIVSSIFKHPSMDLTGCFNFNWQNNLLDKVSKAHKTVFLLGDFNVNLLS